jgi:hypothetical protein
MKTKFKFDASQVDLIKGSIDSFQNEAIKEMANNSILTGGQAASDYSQGHYSQNYSRGSAPIIIVSA